MMKLSLTLAAVAVICFTLIPGALSHAQLNWPPSRNQGDLADGGHCRHGACSWFTQPTSIPGEPTLPHHMRTYNVDVKTGESGDWSAKMPWRSPGASPVSGHGCGIAGGNTVPLPNGGEGGGIDGLKLPPVKNPAVWPKGSEQEVGFGLFANHGGGYSYRLCPLGGAVNESCFQAHPLRFAGTTHELRFDNTSYQYNQPVRLPGFEIPRLTTTQGTFPAGSEWARNPVPGCKMCDQNSCGPGLLPNLTDYFESPLIRLLGYDSDWAYGGLKWFEQQMCAQSCSGINVTKCPPGMLQFPEPVNGISGYFPGAGAQNQVDRGMDFSIMDRVVVPTDLPAGEYLLSFRWDAEQSHQIWQNCADVRLVDQEDVVTPMIA